MIVEKANKLITTQYVYVPQTDAERLAMALIYNSNKYFDFRRFLKLEYAICCYDVDGLWALYENELLHLEDFIYYLNQNQVYKYKLKFNFTFYDTMEDAVTDQLEYNGNTPNDDDWAEKYSMLLNCDEHQREEGIYTLKDGTIVRIY